MRRLYPVFLPVLMGVLAFAICYGWQRSKHDKSTESKVVALAPPAERSATLTADWAVAITERNPAKRLETLTKLLREIPAGDLRKLAQDQVDDPDALALILRQGAESDPRAVAGWVLQQVRDGRVPITTIGPVIDVWAERDPAALTAWFKEPAHATVRNSQLVKLTGVLFLRDPAAALALAHDFPLQWRLPEQAKGWIKADPEAATKLLNSLPFGRYNANAAVGEALPQWAEKDPKAAAEWSVSQGKENEGAGQYFLEKSLETWVSRDPKAAAAFIAKLPPGSAPAEGMVKAWAANDPTAAIQWIEQSPSLKKGELIGAAIMAVADSDVKRAAELVSGMADTHLRDKATAGLTRAWALKDPLAALTWAAALPNGPARNNSLVDAASTWAGKDVNAAAEWAKAAPEGSLPPTAYNQIIWHLGRDIPAAYQWLNELPEGTVE